MRVLSFDPGAERLGWAVTETAPGHVPTYVNSGILYFPRNGKDFQKYKMELIKHTLLVTPILFDYKPEAVVAEVVPAVGGGNFVVATQSYLANVAITVIYALAYQAGIEVDQISARTTQSNIAKRTKSKKISKPQVRNGVISILPVLEPRKSDWVKEFDEPDAIATGLAWQGYSYKQHGND